MKINQIYFESSNARHCFINTFLHARKIFLRMSIMNSRINNRKLALAALAGLMLALGLPPISLSLFPVLSIAMLFYLWLGATPKQGLLYGLAFGGALYTMTLYWLFYGVYKYHNVSPVIALIVVALVVIYTSSFIAMSGYLACYIKDRWIARGNAIFLMVIAPAALTSMELLRGLLLLQVPVNMSFTQLETPLVGWAPIFGGKSITLIMSIIAGALIFLIQEKKTTKRISATSFVLVIYIISRGLQSYDWTVPTGDNVDVTILQQGALIEDHFNREKVLKKLEFYENESAKYFDSSDIIFWPENVVLHPYGVWEDEFYTPLAKRADQHNVKIVHSTPMNIDDVGLVSTATIMGEPKTAYHKKKLFPFAEKWPFSKFLVKNFGIGENYFTEGVNDGPLVVGAIKLAGSICYDDLFLSPLREQLPEAGAMFNLFSNYWFENTMLPWSHFTASRLRSFEMERYLIRVGTTGISSIIDHKGKVIGMIGSFEKGVLQGNVEMRGGSTPYQQWGDIPIGLILLILLALPVVLSVKGRRV